MVTIFIIEGMRVVKQQAERLGLAIRFRELCFSLGTFLIV